MWLPAHDPVGLFRDSFPVSPVCKDLFPVLSPPLSPSKGPGRGGFHTPIRPFMSQSWPPQAHDKNLPIFGRAALPIRVKPRLGTQLARGFSLGSAEEQGVFVLNQPNHLLSLGHAALRCHSEKSCFMTKLRQKGMQRTHRKELMLFSLCDLWPVAANSSLVAALSRWAPAASPRKA